MLWGVRLHISFCAGLENIIHFWDVFPFWGVAQKTWGGELFVLIVLIVPTANDSGVLIVC